MIFHVWDQETWNISSELITIIVEENGNGTKIISATPQGRDGVAKIWCGVGYGTSFQNSLRFGASYGLGSRGPQPA